MFAALVIIGIIIARLYRRSSKEISLSVPVLAAKKVILGGGAIVLPVLHEIIPVNMNTLRSQRFAVLMTKRSLPETVCVLM